MSPNMKIQRWSGAMFPEPLLFVSPLQFATLWGELLEAYHGINGFGGDTAELYSYRFQPYSPTVHSSAVYDGKLKDEAKADHFGRAANALLSLCYQFCYEYDCDCEIDGMTPTKYSNYVNSDELTFDHRAHVRIIR